MVRSEDPPGNQKHLRFELKCDKKMELLYPILISFSGVKAIVRHEGGTNSGKYKEHPHFHVWFESETAITNQTVRNWLNKIPEFVVLQVKSQAMWAFKNHDSFETWCKYVIKNPTYKVLLTHPILTEIQSQETPVVVLNDSVIEHIQTAPVVVRQRASRAERWKLKQFLQETWQWKENAQFTDKDIDVARNQCKAQIIKWYSGWLDDRDGIRMLRFLMFTFGTDALRDELTFKISRNWDNYV